MPGEQRVSQVLILCERFMISLYVITALIHGDRNEIRMARRNGEVPFIFLVRLGCTRADHN